MNTSKKHRTGDLQKRIERARKKGGTRPNCLRTSSSTMT